MKEPMKMIQLSLIMEEEAKGVFTGYCEELGLVTCGHSFEEVERRLQKATGLVLNKATENKEIWQLLKEKGIPVYSTIEYDAQRMYGFNMKSSQWAKPYFHELACAKA